MPEGHAESQGPSLVTQDTPIGNPGPFQAGGQAPPIHWVTVSQQGEFNGIPGQLAGFIENRWSCQMQLMQAKCMLAKMHACEMVSPLHVATAFENGRI